MNENLVLRVGRSISAPPAAVWAAWTDPAVLPRWFGPAGFSCRTKEIDLRPGGLWRFDMLGPDGRIWPNRHRFGPFDPPHRLEYLLDGDDDAAPPIRSVVTFAPEGTGTRVTIEMSFPDAAARAAALSYGAVERGQETLAKLAGVVEAG